MISKTVLEGLSLDSQKNDDDKNQDEIAYKHSTNFILDSIFIFPADKNYLKKNSRQSFDYTTSTGNESQESLSPIDSPSSSPIGSSKKNLILNYSSSSVSYPLNTSTATINQSMTGEFPLHLNKFDNHSNTTSIITPQSNNYKGFELEKSIINLHDIIQRKDQRTTLMIRHIPNKYTLKLFTNEINQKFSNKYDVFYLPIDYVNNCNLGFAFINFVDPLHIVEFYETFRGRKWKKYFSDKICELAYAKIQGKKNLITHFEKGSVLNNQTEDKKPLILTTPFSLPKIALPIKYLSEFKDYYPQHHFTFDKKHLYFVNFT